MSREMTLPELVPVLSAGRHRNPTPNLRPTRQVLPTNRPRSHDVSRTESGNATPSPSGRGQGEGTSA